MNSLIVVIIVLNGVVFAKDKPMAYSSQYYNVEEPLCITPNPQPSVHFQALECLKKKWAPIDPRIEAKKPFKASDNRTCCYFLDALTEAYKSMKKYCPSDKNYTNKIDNDLYASEMDCRDAGITRTEEFCRTVSINDMNDNNCDQYSGHFETTVPPVPPTESPKDSENSSVPKCGRSLVLLSALIVFIYIFLN